MPHYADDLDNANLVEVTLSRIIRLVLSPIAVLATSPAQADEPTQFGTVYAVVSGGEWCPSRSFYIDLDSGAFSHYPRLSRIECAAPKQGYPLVEGRLDGDELAVLRAKATAAKQFGLTSQTCSLIVSNGGKELLALTGPGYSQISPDNPGCWSPAAKALVRSIDTTFDLLKKSRN